MRNMSRICGLAILASSLLYGCSSGPSTTTHGSTHGPSTGPQMSLADKTYFHQQDPRWSQQTLGGSGESLKTDGCLVSSVAMALSNLGFQTDPGDLAARLKVNGGFNAQGWLVWSGIGKVTGGIASTRFYKANSQSAVNEQHARSCIADGFYPLVRFNLPSRSTHWVVVVGETEKGFYVRDPMVASKTPIPLSSRTSGIDAVRCVGVDQV